MMELQLINLECREHTTGSLSLVFAEIVHSKEELVPLEGQVSVTVRFPFSLKWKFLKRGSDDGEEVALTDESMSQVLPTTLIQLPKSFVVLDNLAFCDIRKYEDLFPFFGEVSHFLILLPTESYGSQ